MTSCVKFSCIALLTMLLGMVGLAGLGAKDPEPKKDSEPAAADGANVVKAKPLSDNVKKGLAYLVSQQKEDGGWGQGGGWRQAPKNGGGRVEGADVKDPTDLASTCVATLALLRAGNTAKEGEYAKNVAKALDFIFTKVEKADKETLYVTDVRDTQVQSKIGPYVDTFLAALVLAEMKGKMPDEKGEKRLITALDKTVNKIEINQKADGTFVGNEGWATVLSQGLCSKGLNRAAQAGAKVSPEALAKDQQQSVAGLDRKTGDFKAAAATPPVDIDASASSRIVAEAKPAEPKEGKPGEPKSSKAPDAPKSEAKSAAATSRGGAPSSAGVPLYDNSSKAAGSQEAVNTLRQLEKHNKEVTESSHATKDEKEAAKKELDRVQPQLKQAVEANDAAVRGITAKLGDGKFVQGFGNNGGEEFLSYLNISETMLVKGGQDWEKWDKSMTENLCKVQDKDGGWSGQHCITGRTFCTSTALLVLLADRAPIPVAAKVKGDK